MMLFLLGLSLIISSSNSILDVKSKSVVKYLGDTFLLPDGCPSEDPVVQRFYKLCLETRGGDTLCTTDRKECVRFQLGFTDIYESLAP